MPRQTPVQLDEARAFLQAHFGRPVADVAALGAGGWSRAFSFSLDGRELVARFGQHREDYEADQAAMSYRSADLPVPAVIEIGDALDGAYAISERCHGVFLESLTAAEWERLLPAFWRALDSMRTQDIAWPAEWERDHSELADGPGGFWGAQLCAPLIDRPGARVSGWRAVLAESPELDELFVTAERAMVGLLPACPTAPHLIHSDLLNRNVLVRPDARRLAAVFDWGCRKLGDFVYELAWLTFFAPWHPGLAAIDIRSRALDHYRANGIAVPNFDERLRCYELQIGLEHLAYGAFVGQIHADRAVTERTRAILDAT